MLGSRFDLAAAVGELAERQVLTDDALVAVEVELEREMAVVAQRVHLENPRLSFRCPVCDTRMTVRMEDDLPEFTSFGVQLHELECATCGLITGRAFHPAIGYQALVR